MEDEFFNVSLQDVKREVRRGLVECQKRGLLHSAKWLAEINFGLSEIEIDGCPTDVAIFQENALTGIDPADYDCYHLAKCYYDVKEYDRAAYALRNTVSPVPRFLHLYSTYMSFEKKRLDSLTDQSNLNENANVKDLIGLLTTLRTEHSRGKLDGYGLYLYGVVLKTLNISHTAQKIFMQSIRLVPMLWSSYVELAPLIEDKECLRTLNFGGHWMKHFFVAHTYIEMYLNDEALKAYEELQSAGFHKCVYITAQMGLAYHNKRDVNKAIAVFQNLVDVDPFRLDNLDTYSNLLFVKDHKTEMAQLAHKAVSINKYRSETCCIVGNYYSIRCDHQMAITYFQRALKLNPKYLAAWTLMGHEFMELKNTNAAIQSYRKAVEVNKRDYRAWYGLGQAYEILKMHYYSLYYFKLAHQLRPYDSRMLVALGESYERLDKSENAIKCYAKACDVGDIEGIAMYKMANLHEKLGAFNSAVQCYIMYCNDESAIADKQSLYHGFMTCANYYESNGDYERASYYAYKCLDSEERKSEAKSLLKTIENKRSGKVISTSSANIGDSLNVTGNESGNTEDVVNAGGDAESSSSDEEMQTEMSDYKYSHPFVVTALQLTNEITEETTNFRRTMNMCMLEGDDEESSGSGRAVVRPSSSRTRGATSFNTMLKRFHRIQSGNNIKSTCNRMDLIPFSSPSSSFETSIGQPVTITESMVTDTVTGIAAATGVSVGPCTSTAHTSSLSATMKLDAAGPNTITPMESMIVADQEVNNNNNRHSITKETPNMSIDSIMGD